MIVSVSNADLPIKLQFVRTKLFLAHHSHDSSCHFVCNLNLTAGCCDVHSLLSGAAGDTLAVTCPVRTPRFMSTEIEVRFKYKSSRSMLAERAFPIAFHSIVNAYLVVRKVIQEKQRALLSKTLF